MEHGIMAINEVGASKAINQKITINHTIIELLNNTININEKNNGTNNGVNNGNFEQPYFIGQRYRRGSREVSREVNYHGKVVLEDGGGMTCGDG